MVHNVLMQKSSVRSETIEIKLCYYTVGCLIIKINSYVLNKFSFIGKCIRQNILHINENQE